MNPDFSRTLSLLRQERGISQRKAAAELGCVAAGADDGLRQRARDYGCHIGLAFQVRDDVLDVVADQGELGKPIGSDKRDGKTTFMSLYGEADCARMVEKITDLACDTVAGTDADGFLTELARSLAVRRK